MSDSSPFVHHVMLIGAGGTGSILAPHLARLISYHPSCHEATLTICDGDELELHNLERQSFAAEDVAENKAIALSVQLDQLGLDNTVPLAKYMTPQVLDSWLKTSAAGVRLIIAAVDNDDTRQQILNHLHSFVTGDWVFITPGNGDATTEPRGQVLWCGRIEERFIGVDLTQVYPNIAQPDDVAPTQGGCITAARSAPQLISANMLCAAWTLACIQNLLDCELDPSHHSVFFNIRNLSAIAS